MDAPRYFVAVFGPLEPGKGSVEDGLHVHDGHPRDAAIPGPGDIILVYCTDNYNHLLLRKASPGIGVVLDGDHERTKYRWIQFAQPLARDDIVPNLDPDDAAKMRNIFLKPYWLFEISEHSFSNVVGSRATAWGKLNEQPSISGVANSNDIPDEYLNEIGRVNVRWARLESMIDLCLMKLAGKDILESRSMVIFNHMAFPMKLDVMGALVSELLPGYPGLSGFSAVQGVLREAQEKRNLVIHSKWGVDKTTGNVQISRISARGKLKVSVTAISTGEIRAISDHIAKAYEDLFSLITSAGIKEG